MPMEEALMAFAEIDISRMKNFTSEKEKGIPYRAASSFYSRQPFKGTESGGQGDPVPGRLHTERYG